MLKQEQPQLHWPVYWTLGETVNVIGGRRQQISEDDFQPNPQELWS